MTLPRALSSPWGWDGYGQLGDGLTVQQNKPVPVR